MRLLPALTQYGKHILIVSLSCDLLSLPIFPYFLSKLFSQFSAGKDLVAVSCPLFKCAVFYFWHNPHAGYALMRSILKKKTWFIGPINIKMNRKPQDILVEICHCVWMYFCICQKDLKKTFIHYLGYFWHCITDRNVSQCWSILQ